MKLWHADNTTIQRLQNAVGHTFTWGKSQWQNRWRHNKAQNVFSNNIAATVLLEKAMATHSSTLAWKTPWTEEPGRLQSMGSQRVRHNLSDFTFPFHFQALEKETATHSSIPAWRISGMAEPGGLPSIRSHRVGHNWSDLAAAVATVL